MPPVPPASAVRDHDRDRPGVPSMEALAPLLDRLVELAEQRLPEPYMLMVQGWDDGDLDAYTHHTGGRCSTDDISIPDRHLRSYERIEYDLDREVIVHGRVVTDRRTDEQIERDETVLEEYECPVPIGE